VLLTPSVETQYLLTLARIIGRRGFHGESPEFEFKVPSVST